MTPAYSIIIPAFNEEALLPDTLAALATAMGQAGHRGQIVVVDNNSTDATADIARDRGARVVFEPVNQIARARNTGARHCETRWLVFVDADTIVPPALLGGALDRLHQGGWSGGGARVSTDQPLKGLGAVFLSVWNHFATHSRTAAGSFIFCRRDGFEAVGGFDQRLFAGEELVFSLACRRWSRPKGLHFGIIADPPVITSARKLDAYGPAQVAALALLALFPPAVLLRSLVHPLWYRRLKGSDG